MELESTYSTLQTWYLARLRAEAAELSERSRLTPMARIDSDRIALIQHGVKDSGPESAGARRFAALGVFIYFYILLNVGLLIFAFSKTPSGEVVFSFALSLILNAVAVFVMTSRLRIMQKEAVSLEQQIADTRLRERIIADYAKELLFAFDEQMNVECCNMACLRLLGYLPDQIAGNNLAEISSSKDLSGLRARLQKSKDGRSFEFEFSGISKFGVLVDFAVTAEWSNRVQLFFATARDITAEKAVEKARGEFISMISHDVRAPLQGVLFAIDTLAHPREAEITEKTAKSLSRMEQNVQTVIDLIGELIDFERSADTALALKKANFEVRSLVDEVLEQVRDVAAHKSITLVNETAVVTVKADRARIVRVILNLVANALKFSPTSSKIIVASKEQPSALEIRVTDCGPGIPKHLHTAIFERYFQVDETQPRDAAQNIPGSGLGLAICKAFVEAHDGLIGVESASESSGSTFWFTLPK